MRFEYVVDEGGFIINGLFPKIKQQIALIATAEKGSVNVHLSTKKTGGHSSMPPKATAIGTLSAAVANLRAHKLPAHMEGVTKEMFINLSRYMPFKDRLMFANLWLFQKLIIKSLEQTPLTNALIRTTTAPTIFNAGVKFNVLPIKATATVNFRILPADSIASVVSHVKAIINNSKITVSTSMGWEPSKVSNAKSAAYKLLSHNIQQSFGNAVIITPWVVVGATDSRYFNNLADNVYRFIPVAITSNDLKRIHGTNERLSTKNYLRMIRFYYAMLQS